MNDLIPDYVDALCRELTLVADKVDIPVKIGTVYFGGGTPSLLPMNLYGKILAVLNDKYGVDSDSEITIEANPGTLDEEYLFCLRRAGINRLSIGAQSALESELKLLGRIHQVNDIRKAYEYARQAGFNNINLDFIYGLPGQTCEDWQVSLEMANDMHPEHLSCYALTLEDETPMARMINSGVIPQPDDDQAADCYEMTMDQLDNAGYHQYEISNWAIAGKGTSFECKHNLQYWHNDPYLGFGVGAHGYSNGVRTANVATIPEYINLANTHNEEPFPLSPANETRLLISTDVRQQEALMVGLRLTEEGISRSNYIMKYQTDFYVKFRKQVDQLIGQDLLEWSNDQKACIRLTRKGRLLGNQVFMQFIGDMQ